MNEVAPITVHMNRGEDGIVRYSAELPLPERAQISDRIMDQVEPNLYQRDYEKSTVTFFFTNAQPTYSLWKSDDWDFTGIWDAKLVSE